MDLALASAHSRLIASKHKGAMIDSIAALTDLDSELGAQASLGFLLEHAPDESLVLDIQNALRGTDLGPAADSLDILIAGYAIANDAAVMTADHDLAHIATVTDLIHEYIAPLAAASAVVMFSGPGSVVP